jgi:4-hydroxy-4-methyl-2-oxoglutarate aldolase
MTAHGLVVPILCAAALLAQDARYASSDVADAAEALTGRRAHMGDEMKHLSGTRLTGRAITLRIVRDDDASSTVEGLKVIRLMETAPRGSVIVATVEGDKAFAIFGATFATLAKSRKLGGFVVDGTMRGLSEFKAMGVPMFARGTVPGSAGGHYRLEAVNVPINCGGVEVRPGDLVVGDADGVAIAPGARSTEILANATQLRNEKNALLPLIARYRSYTQAVEARKAQRKDKRE